MPTFTADGDGDEFVVRGNAHMHADGTWGGGTIQWKYKGLDGLYHPMANGLKTADHDVSMPIEKSKLVRPTLTGSTAPSIYYEAT